MYITTILTKYYNISTKFDLGELSCGVFKLEKATGQSAQFKEATPENWELALTLLS